MKKHIKAKSLVEKMTLREKVELAPQERKRVTFALGFDALKEWSTNRTYELFPHTLKLMLGKASDDIVYETELLIK